MLGTDIRDLNFEQLRDRISGLRSVVYTELCRHGPCTTRQLAAKMEVDVLSVRPRVTELEQLGFAECVAREGHEGVYRAFGYEEAAQKLAERRAIARGEGVQSSFL